MFKLKAKTQRVVLPILADLHSGSKKSLLKSGQWQLADGYWVTTKLQQKLWAQFTECIAVVARKRKGKKLVVVNNGDAIENVHHHSTEVITADVHEHERMHIETVDCFLRGTGFDANAGDELYYVGGTPVHDGEGYTNAERVAADFAAVPYQESIRGSKRDAVRVWPMLRLNINGTLIEIAHQGPGVGTRTHTKGNTIRSMVKSTYYERLAAGTPMPDVFVWSHRHEYHREVVSIGNRDFLAFTTPAFKAPDRFFYKVMANRCTHVGLLILEIDEQGAVSYECPLLQGVGQVPIVKI